MFKNFILGFGALSFVASSAFAGPVYVVEGDIIVTGGATNAAGEQLTWASTVVEGNTVPILVSASSSGVTSVSQPVPEGVTIFGTSGISTHGNYRVALGADENGQNLSVIYGPNNSVTVVQGPEVDNAILTIHDDGTYVIMSGGQPHFGSVATGIGAEIAPLNPYGSADVYGFASNPDGSFKWAVGGVPIGTNSGSAAFIKDNSVLLLPSSDTSNAFSISADGNFAGGIDGTTAVVWDLINQTESLILDSLGGFQDGYTFSIISTGAASGEDLTGLGWISVAGMARNAWDFLVNFVGLNISPDETIGRVYLSEDPINGNVNVHWQGSVGMAYQVSKNYFVPNQDIPEPRTWIMLLGALTILTAARLRSSTYMQ